MRGTEARPIDRLVYLGIDVVLEWRGSDVEVRYVRHYLRTRLLSVWMGDKGAFSI